MAAYLPHCGAAWRAPEELVGFLAGVGIREHLRKVLDCYYPEEGVR